MRMRALLQVGLIVFLAVGLTMCKQPSEQPVETPPAAEEPPAAETTPAPSAGTPAAVAEQVRDIREHMRNARRRVRDGDSQEASIELSEAARVYAQHAAASTGSVKEHLEFSASEFTELAERVFGTPGVTIDEMDAALTRAYWALTGYHYVWVSNQWADGQARETAAHLIAAAAFIDEAIGYLPGQIEEESEALVEQMRDVARQLERGDTANNVAITTQIDDFGKKVAEYGDHVRGRIA